MKETLYTLRYKIEFESGIQEYTMHGITGMHITPEDEEGVRHLTVYYDRHYPMTACHWDSSGKLISLEMIEEV